MEEYVIQDDDGKGNTKAFIGTDVEFTDLPGTDMRPAGVADLLRSFFRRGCVGD